MLLTLQRGKPTEHSTSGTLAIDGQFQCFSLEPPPVPDPSNPGPICIPAGTFTITIQRSPKFGRLMPVLQNVPGRSAIEIHWGNFVYDAIHHVFDSEGCILVGTYQHGPDEILATQDAFGHLFPKIQEAIESGDIVKIEVIDAT